MTETLSLGRSRRQVSRRIYYSTLHRTRRFRLSEEVVRDVGLGREARTCAFFSSTSPLLSSPATPTIPSAFHRISRYRRANSCIQSLYIHTPAVMAFKISVATADHLVNDSPTTLRRLAAATEALHIIHGATWPRGRIENALECFAVSSLSGWLDAPWTRLVSQS